MRYHTTAFLIGALLVVSPTILTYAESNARVALMWSGEGCAFSQQTVAETVRRIIGVQSVITDLIPDHLVIDYVRGQVTEEDLATLVHGLLPADGHCRADVMKSCITAEFGALTATKSP